MCFLFKLPNSVVQNTTTVSKMGSFNRSPMATMYFHFKAFSPNILRLCDRGLNNLPYF